MLLIVHNMNKSMIATNGHCCQRFLLQKDLRTAAGKLYTLHPDASPPNRHLHRPKPNAPKILRTTCLFLMNQRV